MRSSQFEVNLCDMCYWQRMVEHIEYHMLEAEERGDLGTAELLSISLKDYMRYLSAFDPVG